MAESKLRIKSIWVYPIKSLRGCELPSMIATPTGLNYDRRFMLQRVKDDENMAVSDFSEMCLFTTELSPPEHPQKILVRYTKDHTFEKIDEKVDDEVLEVPLEPDWKSGGLAERLVNMHTSQTNGYEMAARYNEWFSKRFGYNVRLLYVGDNRRKVLGTVTPNAKPIFLTHNNVNTNATWFGLARTSLNGLMQSLTGPGMYESAYRGVDQGIGFADVAPFLVVSSKSYDNVAARLSREDVDITKFRPNIMIEGADMEFEEDYWAELAIGELNTRIVLTTNCARCASLNVDFDTGKPSKGEAGKVLKVLQKDRRVDPGAKYSPIFGRYGFLAIKGAVEGLDEVEIKVGDAVTITKRNVERTRFCKSCLCAAAQ